MNYALPLIYIRDCREFAIALRLGNRLVNNWRNKGVRL